MTSLGASTIMDSDSTSVRKVRRPFLEAPKHKRQAGLSYVEVLIVVILVAVALTPAIEGLSSNLASASNYGDEVERHHHLASRLEAVLAESFSSLDDAAVAAGSPTADSSYSEPSGRINRRRVFLSRYDADNADDDDDPFTGTDEGLLWIRVELESSGASIEALTRP